MAVLGCRMGVERCRWVFNGCRAVLGVHEFRMTGNGCRMPTDADILQPS